MEGVSNGNFYQSNIINTNQTTPKLGIKSELMDKKEKIEIKIDENLKVIQEKGLFKKWMIISKNLNKSDKKILFFINLKNRNSKKDKCFRKTL